MEDPENTDGAAGDDSQDGDSTNQDAGTTDQGTDQSSDDTSNTFDNGSSSSFDDSSSDGGLGTDYGTSEGVADYANTDALNGVNGNDAGDTLTMSEKWNSLKAAPGAELYAWYDRVAAVYDMVTGDDAAADTHMDDAQGEGDAFTRHLRQAFEGKRIEPSLAEQRSWEHVIGER